MSEAVIKNITTNSKMGNEVRIQETNTGQLTATIPRALANAYGLKKGDTIEWILVEGAIQIKKK